MRPVLIVGAGVAACLVGAVFVGVAAANTGAPVFYDARYPAPASTDPGRYEAGSAAPDDRAGDAVEDAAPDISPAPDATVPSPAPPASDPPAGTPAPEPPARTRTPAPPPTPPPSPNPSC